MKVHSTERHLKFYRQFGWSALLVSQMSTDDAIIEECEDDYGTFYRVYEGEIVPDNLMPMISKIIHHKKCARISRRKYREYVEARVGGTNQCRQFLIQPLSLASNI